MFLSLKPNLSFPWLKTNKQTTTNSVLSQQMEYNYSMQSEAVTK